MFIFLFIFFLTGANPNTLNPSQHSPLGVVFQQWGNDQENYFPLAELLLKFGSKPNYSYPDGNSLLHFVLSNGGGQGRHPDDWVDLLLAHKANVDSLNVNGATPLFLAAAFGYFYVAIKLLENNANIRTTISQAVAIGTFTYAVGDTLLIAAVNGQSPRLLAMLLSCDDNLVLFSSITRAISVANSVQSNECVLVLNDFQSKRQTSIDPSQKNSSGK